MTWVSRRPVTLAWIGLALAVIGMTAQRAYVAAFHTGVWTLMLDRPIVGKYEDFAFPDATHGWLVSARGDILHTADGGMTWSLQASQKGPLRSVDFLDERRGFAGTVAGVLYHTADGGTTWSDITTTLPKSAKGFCGIAHVGDQVHLVGKYTGGAADYFYSPDGGKTWRVTDLRPIAQGLVDIVFLTESVGLLGGMSSTGPAGAGPAAIFKTVDGGQSWRTVFTHDGGRGFAWKIFPVTPNVVYAALQSQDGVYRAAKSMDAGETWEVLTVATDRAEGPGVQGIGFLDENIGWVGGFFAGMYVTRDGGRSWAEVPSTDRTINRFQRVGTTLLTAGSRGILRYDPRGRR